MCYAPITIKNNSKLYRPLTSKDLVQVPCGKCRECQLRKEDDWFVRIYYEWERTCQLGGQCFFVSTGYNDAHLPFLDTKVQEFSSLVPLLNDFRHNTGPFFLLEDDYSTLLRKIDRYEERYEVTPYEIPNFKHACFNPEHIDHFFKLLRQYLHNDGKLKYGAAPLKYFCVSEFGDNKHRSHWHFLIFVPVALDPNYFISVCRKSWSYRVPKDKCPDYVLDKLDECKAAGVKYMNFSTPNGKNWKDWHIQYQPTAKRYIVKRQYGFVNYSKDKNSGQERPIIDDVRGCKYLTRYLNYYDNYLSDKGYDQLKDWIKLFPKNMSQYVGLKHYVDMLHKLSYVFPMKRVSQSFGSLYYEQLQCLSQEQLVDTLKRNEVIIPNELQPYPIPTYIIKRLNYQSLDVDGLPNQVSFLTPLGYKVLTETFDDKLFEKKKMYAETLQVLRSFLTNDDLELLKEKFGYDPNLITCPPIGFDISKLALFDTVLNGVSISHMTDIMHLEDMTDGEIIDNCFDIYINQLILRCDWLDAPQVNFDDLFFLKISNQTYLKARCYNALPQFAYYDKLLTVIYAIRRIVLERDAKTQKDIYTQTTKVREALNSFVYRET